MTTKTATLRSYIGKNSVKTKKTDNTVYQIVPNILASQSALALAQVFDGLVGNKGYTTGKRWRFHMSTFLTLVQRLTLLTNSGIEVHHVDYVLAHKWFYGSELQPWHLITSKSHDIYIAYMRQKTAKKVAFTKKDYESYDAETIAFLSGVRGESEEETRECMADCGLL